MLEDKLHLGKTKKNEFSFGILLDLHYLCTLKTYWKQSQVLRIYTNTATFKNRL
jgi:hypothetical protein